MTVRDDRWLALIKESGLPATRVIGIEEYLDIKAFLLLFEPSSLLGPCTLVTMLFTKAILLSLAALAAAHPGHEEEEHRQAIRSRAERANNKRALAACADKLEARGVYARANERRRATLEAHRKAKRIPLDGENTRLTRHGGPRPLTKPPQLP